MELEFQDVLKKMRETIGTMAQENAILQLTIEKLTKEEDTPTE